MIERATHKFENRKQLKMNGFGDSVVVKVLKLVKCPHESKSNKKKKKKKKKTISLSS